MDFIDLKEWVNSSWKAQADWRETAEDDFAFRDGHQWTDEEKAALEEANRTAIVFNRTAVILASVAGSEINNRTEVRFIPREIGDVKPNEVLTAGGEWFRDQSDAEDAESDAFTNLLTCGVGITDTGLDFDADPEGEPSIESLDPLTVGWDSFARKKGLTDARYFFEVKQMPSDEALERFPEHDASEIHCGWIKASNTSMKTRNEVGDEYGEPNDGDIDTRNTLTVVRIQYRQKERFVEYIEPTTGQKSEMPIDHWNRLMEQMPVQVPHRKVTRNVWRQAFLGNSEVLDENQPDPERATMHFMTGHWDRKDRQFYGLLRSMRDPQKYANKWLSQTLHIINSNAKGGVIAEAGVTDDLVAFEESWSAADGVTWVKPGMMQGIQEKPKVQMPAALMALTEFAVSSIRDVSGVNMELLGLRDANQPGILEYQRRQSAMTTMAHYFDALRFYRKRQGHSILNMLRNWIAPTGRLVRVVREDQVQYIPLAVADDVETYDVIIDDAPSAPNEKEKAWSVIEAMMPMLQQAGLSLDDWASVLEYSPLPSSFVDKVREKAAQQKQQGPTIQEQLAQAELEKTKLEPQLKMMELEADKAEQAAQAQIDSGKLKLDEAKIMLEYEKLNLDRASLGLEREKVDADMLGKQASIVQAITDAVGQQFERLAQNDNQIATSLAALSQQLGGVDQ